MGVDRCSLQAWLSHKSRVLEESPTMMADATTISTAACGINVAGEPAVGQTDNERPSSPTYATASGDSDSAAGGRPAVIAAAQMHGTRGGETSGGGRGHRAVLASVGPSATRWIIRLQCHP